MNFRKNTEPRSQEKKEKKKIILENLYSFLRVEKIFSIKSKGAGILNPNHSKLKILTHK